MNKVKVHIDNDGIVHAEYPLHTIVGIHDVQEEYSKRLAITDKKTPLMVKIHGLAYFTLEAQAFLCSTDHCAITIAAAVVTDSNSGYFKLSKMLLDMFKSAKRPSFDFKVFENDEAALEWLKNYL